MKAGSRNISAPTLRLFVTVVSPLLLQGCAGTHPPPARLVWFLEPGASPAKKAAVQAKAAPVRQPVSSRVPAGRAGETQQQENGEEESSPHQGQPSVTAYGEPSSVREVIGRLDEMHGIAIEMAQLAQGRAGSAALKRFAAALRYDLQMIDRSVRDLGLASVHNPGRYGAWRSELERLQQIPPHSFESAFLHSMERLMQEHLRYLQKAGRTLGAGELRSLLADVRAVLVQQQQLLLQVPIAGEESV